EADVAEARVALRQAVAAERLALIIDEANVDIRLDGPGFESAQDGALPGGRRAVLVQVLEQHAGNVFVQGSIGSKAQRPVLGVRAGVATRGRRATVFKLFKGGTGFPHFRFPQEGIENIPEGKETSRRIGDIASCLSGLNGATRTTLGVRCGFPLVGITAFVRGNRQDFLVPAARCWPAGRWG